MEGMSIVVYNQWKNNGIINKACKKRRIGMVKIISDSTCDLSKEIVDRYNIDIVPLHVLMGDNEYEDGVNITPDEILHGLMPTRQHQKLLHHQWKVLLKLLNHVLKKDMI